jgi:hypothetical protein
MGDGTVVAPSAAHDAGKTISLDLESVSDSENRGISHSNILGASSTLATINDVITSAPGKNENEILDKISKIPGVTIGEPNYSKEPVSLVLSTHSPVELHVYDSMGRHTGLIPKPASLVDVEDGLYRFYDEKIPGSTFRQYADGNTGNFDSYIYLPDHNGEKYSVVVDGTGFGEFTYKIERVRGGESLDTVQYVGMPVTPLTVATTTIAARPSENSPVPILSSSSPVLNIDIDGNGTADIMATSSTKVDSVKYLKSLKNTVGTMAGNMKRGRDLAKRFERLEDLANKGKFKQLHNYGSKLAKKFKHIKFNKIADADRDGILDYVEEYVSQFE